MGFTEEEAKMSFNNQEFGFEAGASFEISAGSVSLEAFANVHGTQTWGEEITKSFSTSVSHTCTAYGENYEKACLYTWQPMKTTVEMILKFTDPDGNKCTKRGGASVYENTKLEYSEYNRFNCPDASSDNHLCSAWKSRGLCE